MRCAGAVRRVAGMHKRIRSPFDVPELRAMIFDWARVMTGHESQTIVFEKTIRATGTAPG